jgi:hypothetical protein
MKIPFCDECGQVLIRAVSPGLATCPDMHGKLKQATVFESRRWVPRLVQSRLDVRKIPTAEVARPLGPRGGKGKKHYEINGTKYRRQPYRLPLGELVIAIVDDRLVTLAPIKDDCATKQPS